MKRAAEGFCDRCERIFKRHRGSVLWRRQRDEHEAFEQLIMAFRSNFIPAFERFRAEYDIYVGPRPTTINPSIGEPIREGYICPPGEEKPPS